MLRLCVIYFYLKPETASLFQGSLSSALAFDTPEKVFDNKIVKTLYWAFNLKITNLSEGSGKSDMHREGS